MNSSAVELDIHVYNNYNYTYTVLRTPLTPWVTTFLLVKVEATQSSGTILCGTPSGNRVSTKQACIAGQIEAGSGLDVEGSRTRPADILVHNWEFGKPAALDFTITSPLNPSTLNEASVMAAWVRCVGPQTCSQ